MNDEDMEEALARSLHLLKAFWYVMIVRGDFELFLVHVQHRLMDVNKLISY